MSDLSKVRGFLMSRRARITPEKVGLAVGAGHRRVSGLRREEVAFLAGVSTEYYTRLERGDLTGVSDSVLDRIATALRLDPAEIEHLYSLADAANPTPRAWRSLGRPEGLRDSARHMLDAITGAPGFIRNDRRDILAANALGRALYAQMFEEPGRTPNTARFTFLDHRALGFYGDWELVANNVVAILRAAEGRRPHDEVLRALVTGLCERSDQFRKLWAKHDVRHHHTGHKHYVHPVVGEIELLFESLPLQPDTGLSLAIYPAEPGSPSERTLARLKATLPLDNPSPAAESRPPAVAQAN